MCQAKRPFANNLFTYSFIFRLLSIWKILHHSDLHRVPLCLGIYRTQVALQYLKQLQAIESRLALVRVMAEQWFGVFMRAKTPADVWLLKGLAGWMEDQFVRKYMGKSEYIYR